MSLDLRAPVVRALCVLCVTTLLAGVLACDTKKEPVKDPKPGVDAGQSGKSEADVLAQKEARFQELLGGVHEKMARNEDLNEREYELLVLDLKSCEVDDTRGYVDAKCEAFARLKSARSRPNRSVPNQPDMWRMIAEKSLDHGSEAVRIYSTQLMNASYAAKQGSYDKLLERAEVETSPVVLQAIVRALRMHVGKDARVAKRLLALSSHQNDALRESVIIGLTSAWATGSEGTLERALEMIEKDSSAQVRKSGCANMGARADDRAMPLLTRYTAWPAEDEVVYGDCLRGLVAMWSAPVPHKRPSKAAYELTMARFSEKPRDEKHPAWMAVSGLSWASKPALLERAPWVDVGRVEGLLVSMIEDKQMNWLGRNAAITALVQMGAGADRLEAIRERAYKDTSPTGTSPDKYVLNKLDEQIERLSPKTKKDDKE